jgi:hypothetical protein
MQQDRIDAIWLTDDVGCDGKMSAMKLIYLCGLLPEAKQKPLLSAGNVYPQGGSGTHPRYLTLFFFPNLYHFLLVNANVSNTWRRINYIYSEFKVILIIVIIVEFSCNLK